MKLIIAGSRGITDYATVRTAVVTTGLWDGYGYKIEVVCGMARGVDRLGLDFAKRNSLKWHEFPADWDKLGLRAGYVRNKQMGDFADQLLAIWDGESKGTRQMIEYMQSLRKQTHIYKV